MSNTNLYDLSLILNYTFQALGVGLLGYDLYCGWKRGIKVASFSQIFSNYLILALAYFLINPLYDAFKNPLNNFYTAHRLFDAELPRNFATFFLAYFLMDFAYYVYHRIHHTIPFFWYIIHAPHHSDQYLNVSSAHRLSFVVVAFLYQSPILALGVPFDVFILAFVANAVYGIWLHSRFFPKIPYLEWVIFTPSGHRVHHGINPQYMNKNFGNTFTIFDRLGGTYEPEVEEPIYNIPGFSTDNFFKIHFVGVIQYLNQRKSRANKSQQPQQTDPERLKKSS